MAAGKVGGEVWRLKRARHARYHEGTTVTDRIESAWRRSSAAAASSVLAMSAALLAVGPAQAAMSRAWVSGHGTDTAGCGLSTNPCRSLQYTHDTIIAA